MHQDEYDKTRERLTNALLGDRSGTTEVGFDDHSLETALEPSEKCTLYFMLSHYVNLTALPDESDFYTHTRYINPVPGSTAFHPDSGVRSKRQWKWWTTDTTTQRPSSDADDRFRTMVNQERNKEKEVNREWSREKELNAEVERIRNRDRAGPNPTDFPESYDIKATR